jgi:hypothetical protein
MTTLLAKMDSTQGRKTSFLRFINERENIRKKKEKGDPAPWTTDPVLQQYHFCNMKRGDDRVTIWIGEWVAKWAKEERWFACAVARWINEPDTLSQLPTKWNPTVYKNILRKMEEKGLKIFRAAYIITGVVAGPGQKKYVAVVDSVLDYMHKNPPANIPHNFEACWRMLRQYPGQGTFMAGQIVADWNTFGIIRASDTKTWAPLGPGSIKGLNIIYCGDADARKMTQEQGVIWMRELADLIDDKLPATGARLTLHDVQNCLCEFSKYVRGYSKTKYVPFEEKFI